MKKHVSFLKPGALYVACVAMILLLDSCQDKVEITREYTVFEPVYLSLNDLREGFEVTTPQTIEERGKLYLYQNWIFINDPGKGIHVIDNSNPASPSPVSYLTLPGNYSFSIRNNQLYADSYIDLVVLNISNMSDIQEVNRLEGIFSNFNDDFVIDSENGLIIDYEPVRKVEVTVEETGGNFEDFYTYNSVDFLYRFAENAVASSDAAFVPQNQTGIGGSLATFTIVDEFLYALDDSNIHTFNISNAASPVKVSELFLGWDIETLFPYNSSLFVGAQSGMYIVDNTNQSSPDLITKYEHVVSCDPVVVQNDRAYVTLRDGRNCGGSLNQLEVIDISNLSNPTQIAEYPMTNPHGLGIDGNVLFVCEGAGGLKVFDATDDLKISQNMISQLSNIDAYDVIPFNNTLFLIGADGLFQYDYSDPEDILLISKLEITPSSEL